MAAQVMDFGWVQFTEAKILAEFIKTDAYKMEVRPADKWLLGSCSPVPATLDT